MGASGLGMAAGALLLAALVYLGVIHHAAWRERARRRQGGPARVAAHIWPPHHAPSLAQDIASLPRRLVGVVTDQPRALPLAAAIIAGGAALILALDPIMDDPLLSGATLRFLPAWAKLAYALLVGALVIGHALWVFLAAPKALSRQWILLHPDGRISAADGTFPELDPKRPTRAYDGISMPARRLDGMEIPAGWAPGAVIAQDPLTGGDPTVVAFVAIPQNPRPGSLRRHAITPRGWHRVDLGDEDETFAAFFRHHHPDAPRALAPGWNLPPPGAQGAA